MSPDTRCRTLFEGVRAWHGVMRTHRHLPAAWWTLMLMRCCCVEVGALVAGACSLHFTWDTAARWQWRPPIAQPRSATCRLLQEARAWRRLPADQTCACQHLIGLFLGQCYLPAFADQVLKSVTSVTTYIQVGF